MTELERTEQIYKDITNMVMSLSGSEEFKIELLGEIIRYGSMRANLVIDNWERSLRASERLQEYVCRK